MKKWIGTLLCFLFLSSMSLVEAEVREILLNKEIKLNFEIEKKTPR